MIDGMNNALLAIDQGKTNRAKSFAQKAKNLKSEDVENEKAQLKEQVEDFVSILVFQMVAGMRKTVPKTGLIDGGNAERIFQSMLDQEYASAITKTSNFDLVEQVYNQLSAGIY